MDVENGSPQQREEAQAQEQAQSGRDQQRRAGRNTAEMKWWEQKEDKERRRWRGSGRHLHSRAFLPDHLPR
ncbi:hypothetical protein KL948_002194, partial [Ogataea haglerorum]